MSIESVKKNTILTMILRSYSLSNTNCSDIKQLFVEAIKNKIQEKIDRLNQVKNDVAL